MWRNLIPVIISKPRYMLGTGLLLMFAVMAVFGSMFYPHGAPVNPSNLYGPSTWADPLGTDFLGGDIFAELILGARAVLSVALEATILTMGIGVLVGGIAGYIGGWLDNVLMRLVDFVLAIPGFPLTLVVVVSFHITGGFGLAVVLSLTGWAGLSRALRAQVLSLKHTDFVEAARSLEMGRARVVFSEIVPLMMPYIVIHLILNITGVVYSEVGLFFLGVMPLNMDNWGVLLSLAQTNGSLYAREGIGMFLGPMITIILLQMGAIFFSNALEEVFNPALREQSTVHRPRKHRKSKEVGPSDPATV